MRPSAINGSATIDGTDQAVQLSGTARPKRAMSMAPMAARHTSTRASAVARLSASAPISAATIGTVARSDAVYTDAAARALSAAETGRPPIGVIMRLLPFRPQPLDHARELRTLGVGERTVDVVEQRDHRRRSRSTEECSDEMPYGALLGDASWRGGIVDMARSVLLVAKVTLVLENAEHR